MIVLLPWIAVTLVFCGATAPDHPKRRAAGWAIVWLSTLASLIGVLLVDADAGVTVAEHLEGALLAAAVVGGITAAYFGVGRMSGGKPWIATLAAVLITPVASFAVIAGALTVAALVTCGPDAYECPV